jgi:hypothetical protein
MHLGWAIFLYTCNCRVITFTHVERVAKTFVWEWEDKNMDASMIVWRLRVRDFSG